MCCSTSYVYQLTSKNILRVSASEGNTASGGNTTGSTDYSKRVIFLVHLQISIIRNEKGMNHPLGPNVKPIRKNILVLYQTLVLVAPSNCDQN